MSTTYADQPPPYSDAEQVGWKPPEQSYAPPGGYPQQQPYAPQAGYSQYPQQQQAYSAFPDTQQGYTYSANNASADGGEIGQGQFTFSDKTIRHAFIRKVFLILTCQLLVTTGICCIFYFVDDLKMFVMRNSWTYYIGYAVFLVTYIALVCCRTCSRKTPHNYIALTILTLAMTYMVAVITSFYDIESIMIAFGITVALCLALTLFAWQTKIDFTLCTGLLFCLVIVLFLTGMAIWIWALVIGTWTKTMMVVYGGIGALVFSFFLMYDVQVVIGGRKYELSPEEYVYGAVQIYLDVVYIFLMILSIVGGSRGD